MESKTLRFLKNSRPDPRAVFEKVESMEATDQLSKKIWLNKRKVRRNNPKPRKSFLRNYRKLQSGLNNIKLVRKP